jgi:hypothetical protein
MTNDSHGTGTDPEKPDESQDLPDRPVFQHPQWMLGVVLVFALITIGAGLSNPIWLLIGSPFLVVLVIYLWFWLSSR